MPENFHMIYRESNIYEIIEQEWREMRSAIRIAEGHDAKFASSIELRNASKFWLETPAASLASKDDCF
jgi:hypothetical protein